MILRHSPELQQQFLRLSPELRTTLGQLHVGREEVT